LAYNALWGKLAAEILMQNWEAALEDLNKLKDVIDSAVSPWVYGCSGCLAMHYLKKYTAQIEKLTHSVWLEVSMIATANND